MRLRCEGDWVWRKLSRMSTRELINGITVLTRGFQAFVRTSHSYARRLEFSLRRPGKTLHEPSTLALALTEFKRGLKQASILYVPEQRALYRLLTRIESLMDRINGILVQVRTHTKCSRKMWRGFWEERKGPSKFQESAERKLLRELSFAFDIEPPSLFT